MAREWVLYPLTELAAYTECQLIEMTCQTEADSAHATRAPKGGGHPAIHPVPTFKVNDLGRQNLDVSDDTRAPKRCSYRAQALSGFAGYPECRIADTGGIIEQLSLGFSLDVPMSRQAR